MPAKSDNQATAARIALNAKRNGTVGKLPKNSPSHKMATSMSEKELEKFTHVKKEAVTAWAKKSLTEVFAEEMLDTDGPGEEIASQKSLHDIIDAISDTDNETRIDSDDATWPSKVNGRSGQAGDPMALNSLGGRIAEQSLDREDFGSDHGLGSFDDEHDFAEPISGDAADAMAEMETQKREQIINGMVDHLMFHHNKYGTPVSHWDPEDLVMDNEYEFDISTENPEDIDLAREAMNIAAKNTGEELPAADALTSDVASSHEDPAVTFPGIDHENFDVTESIESGNEMLTEAISMDRWKQLANLK